MARKINEKITNVFPEAENKEFASDMRKALGGDDGKVD